MSAGTLSGTFESRSRFNVILLLVLASFILPHIPLLSLVTLPISSFTTTIHESGHAIACLLTGGTVSGMSIVADGEGHGGLTYCQGGIGFIITQAGYITTALVGCALILLGKYPRLSKGVLFLIGLGFGGVGLFFMGGGILHGSGFAGIGSMLIALAMSATMIWVSIKAKFYWANLLLLFLGVQTALNALNDDGTLIVQALGGMPGTWSDASNMQNYVPFVPPAFWAGLWTLIAVGLLWKTLAWSYGKKRISVS